LAWGDEVAAEPLGGVCLVPFAGRDRQDRAFGFIDAGHWIPSPVVDLDEVAERDPCGAFVAVWERAVLCQSHKQYRGLVEELGVELRLAESASTAIAR
jgi:hypothetical protein